MKIDNDNNYTSKNVKVNIDCSNSFQKIGKLIKLVDKLETEKYIKHIYDILAQIWGGYHITSDF